MKYLLWLLGTSLFALILTLVLAAIGVSGVQSLNAASSFLWIAFAIYAGILLDLGIRETSKHHGSKAALMGSGALRGEGAGKTCGVGGFGAGGGGIFCTAV